MWVQSLLTQNLIDLSLTLGGLAGLLALLHLTERAVGRFLSHRLGWNAVLLTAWLGVPVHELSHLAMAKLLGHRIIDFRLFSPDPVSGTLGYVRHGCSRRSPIQRLGGLFIGLAPALLGGSLLLAILAWMVPPAHLLQLVGRLTAAADGSASSVAAAADGFGVVGVLAQLIWHHRSPLLPLQLYLAVCVASHLSPGAADLKGAAPGGALALLLALAAAVAAAHQGLSLAGAPLLLAPLVLVVLASALFQGLYAGVVWGVLRMFKGRSKGGRRATARRCRA